MRTFWRILAFLVILGIIALAAIIMVPVARTPPAQLLPAEWQPEAGAGEYVMRAADCIACHTAEGGADFAGGYPIESPIGTIYGANITPDVETGIGAWTLAQFRGALIDGLDAQGHHLYPAMPYENYRLLTEADIRALYQYFMEEVPPVRNQVPEPDLPFPFNQRWGIRVLNWLLLAHPAGFTPTMGDPVLDRGQYLVEAPGHCAACHSPRTFYMGQDGLRAGEGNFLAGGLIDGEEAPPLHGPDSVLRNWPVSEISAYLATGRNFESNATGEMATVVAHSLQYLDDDDLIAMARFLKVLDGQPDEVPQRAVAQGPLSRAAEQRADETVAMLTQAAPDMPLGARLYLDNCAQCHFVTGRGSPEIFPALQGNSRVTSDEIRPLIDITLNGTHLEGTAQRPMALVMQGYRDRLDDAEIAELLTFIRSAWGNDGGRVTAADVAEQRVNTP